MENRIPWIITSVTRNTNARAPVLPMEFARSLLFKKKKFGRVIYHLKVLLIHTSVYRINEKIARLRYTIMKNSIRVVIIAILPPLIDAQSSAPNVKVTVKRSMVTMAITTPILIATKKIVYSHQQLEVHRYRSCMRAKSEYIKLERHVSLKVAKPHVQGRGERITTSKNAKAQKRAMLRLILRSNTQPRSLNPTQPKYSTNGSVKAIGTH
jgi:hypothetical protein